MPVVDYVRAQDLNQALAFLDAHGPETQLLAGGTDVMVDLRSGDLQPRYLLDISRLEELKRIELLPNQLKIGAAVTISELSASDLVAQHAPTLQAAAEKFASTQIRNVATVGGNIAHCSPCGDAVPPLLVHDTRAAVSGIDGQRSVAVEDMAGGPYRCALGPAELITHFDLALPPPGVTYSGFHKIGRRRELAIARMSMAVMAGQSAEGKVEFLRFALGACTPTPHRFDDVEKALIDQVPDDRLLWETGRLLADQMLVVTGRRPSAIYKEPAIQGLFVRLLQPLVR